MIWFAAATAVFLYFTRPAWVTFVLAGLATITVQPLGPDWIGATSGGLAPDLASPRLVIAAGLVAWAVRHKSWRMGAAAVVFGGLVLCTDRVFVPTLLLFTAAALAAAPRRPLWSGGIVVLAAAAGLAFLGVIPGGTVITALPGVVWIAFGVAVLLVAVAPRPAWVALLLAGFGALAAHTVTLTPRFLIDACAAPGAVCGTAPGWYSAEERTAQVTIGSYADIGALGRDHAYWDTWWSFTPVWFVVAAVLVWALRRRSWRVAVAGVAFGAVLWAMPENAAITMFAAAAAALGPRRDPFYLAGIGVLALALADRHGPWTLVVTIVAIAVGLALGIWAYLSKNGLNGAIAVVALAVAPLTPLFTAGVLLAAPVLRRAARWGGTPTRSPAR
ncbi:hypothetical protein [Nocardia sp. NRRL S-836]|uniref:hypothetical protein n=1 Tax=Nocardia sp. NRRL S-836 TaxID=1519492 RepID=UPI0006ADCEAE|nr:hypothetical protein [Nocardia sp. NRRL S-836]KOV78557.1 hypothetical protein ADL03_39590 [Nocardia sp. NRRL S-836]